MHDDDDLAILLAHVKQRLVAAERPVLDTHGLTMWEYIALAELSRGRAPTQLALAEQMGYDKTRLIALLDGLADRGLVAREPDPADRRARIVSLTAAGRSRLRAARADIRALEDQLLAGLEAGRPEALRATLAALAGGLRVED